MSNRILDYPEATEITSDDYILLDNEGTGAKCIKASALNINMDNYTIKEASGAIASFDDGEDLPLAFMGAYITAIQDLHGYDYPWVGGAGKNKLPLTVEGIKNANTTALWNENSTEINGITYTILTNDSGAVIGINANGIASANSILYLMSTTTPPIQLDGQSVIISMAGFSKGAYKDNSWHDIWAPSTETVTLNGDVVQMWGQINNGVQVNNIVIQPMIRLASVSDSTFAPYSNVCPIIGWSAVDVTIQDDIDNPTTTETITIQLGSTYYGGKLDVVSGVLTVDRGYVDLGTLDWQYSSISERFYVGASDLGVKATDASTPFNAISSALIAKSYNEIEAKTIDYAIGINPNATQLFARYSSITSASDFITAMNGVQLVYELATPLTYQLSKQQIKSLVGENNIFADTGDSVVDYRKLWVKPEM